MAKRATVIAGMLTILLAAAVPTLAQQKVEATGYLSPVYPQDTYSHLLNDEATGATYFARSEVVDLDSYDDGQRVVARGAAATDERQPEPILKVIEVEPAEDPSPRETATLTFELAVEGEPPADATFFGSVRAEGSRYVPLTDPDGDGLYTGSTTASRFPPGTRPLPPDTEPVSLPIQIVQGTGTQSTNEDDSPRPGEPTRVIEDFGLVQVEDKTLSASVSFEGDREGYTTADPGNDDSGDIIESLLPGTGGGVVLAALGMAALLIVGGLLARRVTR
jgi:hypothetical protein